MSRRLVSQTFPSPPPTWEPSSQDAWNRLIAVLENSPLFDKGRRSTPRFVVKGTISAPTTLDLSTPEVTVLAHIVAKLLDAVNSLPQVDVRTTV